MSEPGGRAPRGGALAGCWKLLGVCWQQDRRKTVLSVLLMLSGAAAAPLASYALSQVVSDAVGHRAAEAAWTGAILAVLAVAALTFAHFAHIAYFELSELNLVDADERIIRLSNGSPGLAHHEDPAFADRLTLLQQEVQQFRVGLQALLTLAGLAVAMIITAVLLAEVDPVLLLLPLLALPPLWAGQTAERIVDRAKLATAESNRLALGLFQLSSRAAAAKELRISRLQDEVMRRHSAHWSQVTDALWRAQVRAAALRAAGQLVFAAGYLGSVLLVLTQAVSGHQSIGGVVLAVSLAVQVNQQVSTTFPLVQDLQRIGSAFRHMDEMRRVIDGLTDSCGAAAPPDRLSEGIRFEHVVFGYPGSAAPVLDGVDLELRPGTAVAVVGENGVGKSTLVKLLCGFYQPTGGRILIDGTDLRDLSTQAWRERIAAGFQDFARYEFTARDVVSVGDLPRLADEEAVRGALERAHGLDVLDSLPSGLSTELGASNVGGTELSGGQWQKLALGRAFMRREPLLVVLDEPTSALDAETEHALFERYAEQARRAGERTGAITFFVSHRFSTVRMADLILVVNGGEIVEAGSHAELVRRGCLYAELYDIQAGAYNS
jgi:ATP-binding cassette, subfamily B, bacterial